MLHNLITWHEFYTVRPASRGLSSVESELGARIDNQSLYEVSMLAAQGEAGGRGTSPQLGFYLSQHDFEEKLFQEICE